MSSLILMHVFVETHHILNTIGCSTADIVSSRL